MIFSNHLKAAIAGIALGALSALSAAATTLPISADLTISASVGNPVTSGALPVSTTITSFGAGNEYSFSSNDLITFTSGGFPQTMTGTVGIDITAGQIVLSYSGQAQGVGLTFALSNIDFGVPGMIISNASETGSSGVISGVNATQSVFFGPDSISGGFTLFGFQPGTNLTQTISFDTLIEPTSQVPLPASLPLLLAAVGGLHLVRRRKS